MTNLAYPIGDVLLLALIVFVFSVTRWQPGRAWTLIAAGLLLNAVGDAVYLYQTAVGTYVEGTYLDLVWPLSLVLVALAAWQRPGRVPRVELQERALLGTPFVCGLTATGVLVAAIPGACSPLALILACTDDRARPRADGAELLGEHAAARGQPHRGAHGFADGARQPAQAPRSTSRSSSSARTRGEPRMLVLFDLNGFKTYNDTFGHPAGDALLTRLAAKLAAAVAPDGNAYRMGGDEFCVLLPASEPELHRVAEALCGERRGLRRHERLRSGGDSRTTRRRSRPR